MQRIAPENDRPHGFAWTVVLPGVVFLSCWIAGCSSVTPTTSTSTKTSSGSQTYFAPLVAGTSGINLVSQTYAIDDGAGTFSQSIYKPVAPPGPQVINAGVFTPAQRGLLSLETTTHYVFNGSSNYPAYVATTYNPPQAGSFAVELVSQAGALVQMLGQPGAPLAAATQCPNLASAQTYQFITIPAALISPGGGQQQYGWNPTTDTAYGSVDISSSGSTVTFANITQHTLPSAGGTGAPAQPAPSSPTGLCGPTFFGNTISIPGQLVITNPGEGSQTIPPQATVGIGATGLLVEDNGDSSGGTLPDTSPALFYDNVLGAGTGAVGLPKPSSALDISGDTGSVTGAQYLGFIYGAGKFGAVSSSPTGWSSHLASFGFSGYPTLPPGCSTFAAQTGKLANGIYGGDFQQTNGQDDPSTSPDGFGNCDFAIDLGTTFASNNSLYTQATVWIGENYAGNPTHATYSFHAIAIAGQLNGKYAIFVLGVDSTQPWAIDLLQSN